MIRNDTYKDKSPEFDTEEDWLEKNLDTDYQG